MGITTRHAVGESIVTLNASERLGRQRVLLTNYVPIPLVAAPDQRWRGHLDGPAGARHLGGLTFDRWWQCWLALNDVARSWTAHYGLAGDIATDAATGSDMEALRIAAEASNLGMIEVRIDRLQDAVLTVRPSFELAPADFRAFAASLTLQESASVEFLESPYVFYPTGTGTMHWDLLRHGGVLPGLARLIASGRSDGGRQIGAYFEAQVHTMLGTIAALTHLRHDVRIVEGEELMQVDHGFVIGDVLVLVESRYQQQSRGYFVAHPEVFADRAAKPTLGWLADRDDKLRKYRSYLAREWAAAGPTHAVYVVCSREREFIPSERPELWLDRGRDIPRVCTLQELQEFLVDVAPQDLVTHPASVRL